MSEKLKKINFVEGPLRKLSFCKWASPKRQKIIKQEGPSRQLFETVDFAFMKIFDSLVKIPILGYFSFFGGDLYHALQTKQTRDLDRNERRKSLK